MTSDASGAPDDAAASQPLVLAIDNGSQSTKVHVFDAHGAVRASAQKPLRPSMSPAPGQVVHPGDDLWDSISAACREVMGALGPADGQVVAVGLCTIRFCRALLDADGRLAEPVFSWMDERVSRPYEPVNERVARVTTTSGYISARLTGSFVDTAANYQGMWPIDQATARWSDDPGEFERTGLPRELLFDLVDPGQELGRVTSAAAAATGLPVGVPVYATANDKAVEALGAGLDDDSVLLSLGTYIAAMAQGRDALARSGDYWVNFGSRPGSYLYESNGIRRGMWTVSWIRDVLMPPSDVPVAPGAAERILEAEACEVPPGCRGLAAVMDWLAPTDAPHRRGALLGFDGSQGRGAIYRAILEGIALTMADHIEAMEQALGRRFQQVIVTGGGAKSDLVLRMLAAVLDRPARRAAFDDAAGLGSAICAAVGAGVHPDWDAAVRAMVRPGVRFGPEPDLVAAYRPVRTRHRRARRLTDDLFADLADADAVPQLSTPPDATP